MAIAALIGVAAPVGLYAAPAHAVTECNTPSTMNGHDLPSGKMICEYSYTRIVYDSRIHVFVVGTNRQIYHTFQISEGGRFTVRWSSLGGQGYSGVDALATGRALGLWVVGYNNGYHCYFKVYNHPDHPAGTWWPGQLTWDRVADINCGL